MRLHELTDAGLQILELLETGGDYSKALSDINTEFNDKVLDCGMVYRNIQVEAEVYKTESKRLADKANSLEKRAEGLRVYVEQQMGQLGIESIKGSTFTVRIPWMLSDPARADTPTGEGLDQFAQSRFE